MRVVVVMGVAGSGKSTVGPLIARALGGDYAEGDQFHPPANIAKMTSGQPLDDADRLPWLEAMARAIRDWRTKERPTILACSALKQRYRDILSDGSDDVAFVFLKGSPELIASRIGSRKGHFMPSSLLDSQFRALEEPTPDQAIIVDATQPPDRIAADAVAQLKR